MNKTVINTESLQPFRLEDIKWDVNALTDSIGAFAWKETNNSSTTATWIKNDSLADVSGNAVRSSDAYIAYQGEIFRLKAQTYTGKTVAQLADYYISIAETFDLSGYKTYLNNVQYNTRQIREIVLTDSNTGIDILYKNVKFPKIKSLYSTTNENEYMILRSNNAYFLNVFGSDNIREAVVIKESGEAAVYASYSGITESVRVSDNNQSIRTYRFNDTIQYASANLLWGSYTGNSTIYPFSALNTEVAVSKYAKNLFFENGEQMGLKYQGLAQNPQYILGMSEDPGYGTVDQKYHNHLTASLRVSYAGTSGTANEISTSRLVRGVLPFATIVTLDDPIDLTNPFGTTDIIVTATVESTSFVLAVGIKTITTSTISFRVSNTGISGKIHYIIIKA